ncbi:uncharacterized protein LOC135835387 [Planococcus citri]|uniref:uncharacterized protein LOC135835387 n=1 Tax=Planococcus citri TaxID=170843 RepID=UPI0031F84D64
MASLKFAFFALVAVAFVMAARGDDFTDAVNQGIDKAKETVGITTEKKGLFDSFKEKAGNFYDAAVEKGKEAYQATKEAVSDGVDKVKEKINELRDKKPETPNPADIVNTNTQ